MNPMKAGLTIHRAKETDASCSLLYREMRCRGGNGWLSARCLCPIQYICVWIFICSSFWSWCQCYISHQHLLIHSKGTTLIWCFGRAVAVGLFISLSVSFRLFFKKKISVTSFPLYKTDLSQNDGLEIGFKVYFYTICIFLIGLETGILYYNCIIFLSPEYVRIIRLCMYL